MNGRGGGLAGAGVGRQYSRGPLVDGAEPRRRRKFRGQYVRRRTPSGGGLGANNYRDGSFSDDRNDSSPPPPPRHHDNDYNSTSSNHQQPHYQQQQQHRMQNRRGSARNNNHQQYSKNSRQDRGGQFYDDYYQQQRQQQPTISGRTYEVSDNEFQNDHGAEQVHSAAPAAGHSSKRTIADLTRSFQDNKADIDEIKSMFSKLTTELDQVKRRVKELESTGNTKPNNRRAAGPKDVAPKDAATKDAAQKEAGSKDAGTEEGGDSKMTEKNKRKKSKFPKRGPRERKSTKSPERQSNSLNKRESNAKGTKVDHEFAASILDHAICDVSSPTKLSEIANNLYQFLVGDENSSRVNTHKFYSFYNALKDISNREDDIAIDAPRYMDILGQLLAECVVPMYEKHKNLVRKFLNRCVEVYCPQNKAVLLASIMKAICSIRSDQFAKEVWDFAHLSWDGLLNEGTDMKEFLESHEVVFTTITFTPKPEASQTTPDEPEKVDDLPKE